MFHLILKKYLKVRNIFARWAPHLLTDEQNRQRVKVAKKLLQMFQTYDKKQFANVVAGDENGVYYFELVRKVSNNIWATKHSRRPIIVKRPLRAKNVWYAIFFSGEGVTIKVPVEKGKNITRKYYKDIVLEKRKISESIRHGYGPAHASEMDMVFLKKEKVTFLPHLQNSLDHAPCDFFMFSKLK